MHINRGGQTSLRLDAAYCLAAGCLAVALAGPAAQWFGVPSSVLVGVGAATVVWSAALAWLSRRPSRGGVRLVMAANAAAALALAGLAVAAPRLAVTIFVLAVAVEVGAFAASQGVVLRRWPALD